MDTNKYIYFGVSIDIPNRFGVNIDFIKEKIENKMDLVLYSMNATSDIAIFKESKNKQIVYLFKSSKRKRFCQLVRLLKKYLPNYIYEREHLTKKAFVATISEFKNNPSYSNKNESSNSSDYIYNGEDRQIFDKENLYPWQEELKKVIIVPLFIFMILMVILINLALLSIYYI